MKKIIAFVLTICILFTCTVTVGAESASDGLSFISTMPIYREETWIKRKYVSPKQSNLIVNGGFETDDGLWNSPAFLRAAVVSSEPAAVHSGNRGLIVSAKSGEVANPISNPGFEFGMDHWNKSTSFSGIVTDEQAYSGTKSLKITNLPRYATASCSAEVTKNTEYTLKFYYLGNAKYSSCIVRNSSGGTITSYVLQSGNEGCTEWKECTVSFSSGDNSTVTIEIFATAKGTGTYYLDDFCLSDGKKNDKYSISFPVSVEKNTEYLIGMWMKAAPFDPETNRNDLFWGVSDSNAGNLVYPGVLPVDDGVWHLVGYFFNSGNKDTVYVTLNGNKTTAYVDDMFLCKSNEKIEYDAPEELLEDAQVTNGSLQQTLYNASDNLFDDYDFSASGAEEDFWMDKNGTLFGKQVTVLDSGTPEQGKALHYCVAKTPAGKPFPTGAYYMRELAVTPNTEYYFSVKYRIVSPATNLIGEISNFAILAANRKVPIEIKRFNLDSSAYHSGKWQTVSFSFTTGGYDKIAFSLLDAGGEVYFDDFILIHKDLALGENLVDNAGFEKEDEDWYIEPFNLHQNDRVFETDNPHSGKKAYYIQPEEAYQLVLKKVTLQKNTDYVFSFWYRGTPGWAQYIVRPTGGASIAKEVFLGSGDEVTKWTKVTVPFNSGNDTSYQVGVMTGGTSYPFWIDDISVNTIGEAEPADNAILKNGDFEHNALSEWSFTSGRFDLQSENPYSGTKYLKANPGYDSGLTYSEIKQTVSVKANTNYILSYRVRGSAQKATLAVTNGSGNNIFTQNKLTNETATDWKYGYIRFNTGNNQSVSVGFRQTSTSAVWYLDDIKLYQSENKVQGSENELGAVRVFAQRVLPGTQIPFCISVKSGYKAIGLSAVPTSNQTTASAADLTEDAIDGIVTMPGFDAVLQAMITELSDVNSDMSVDIRDLIRMKKICIDNQIVYDSGSDPNEDGAFNSADLIFIRNRLLK